ncbi:hypothetical protein [Xylanimonas allomyrinae]|nr:hypothetical protein [Xylanimonas allomyrinae]
MAAGGAALLLAAGVLTTAGAGRLPTVDAQRVSAGTAAAPRTMRAA